MTLTQLEKAQKLVNEVKEIDKQIIQLDKLAMLIAEGNTKARININYKDPNQSQLDTPVEKEEMMQPLSFLSMLAGTKSIEITEIKSTDEIGLNFNPTESEIFGVLAVLLSSLQSNRKSLILKLPKWGVSA